MRKTLSTLAGGLLAAGVLLSGSAMAADKIVIGAALSQTGNLADSAAHVRKAYELWAEQVNAKGGLLGQQVELKFYDDKSDAAASAKLYERLISEDKVNFLMGPYGSSATIAASAVAEKHKRVMMNCSGASQAIHERGFKYTFQVVAPIPEYVAGIFPMAKREGYKTIVVVSRDYSSARDMEAAIKKGAKENGMQVLLSEYFPATTSDFSSYIAKARELNPDVWISLGYPNEAIEMVRQMHASNYLPKMFVHNGVSQEDFLTAAGKEGEYAFGMSVYESMLKTEGNDAFVASFKKKWGFEPGYYAAVGYAGAIVLQRAVEQIGTANDQQKLREALRNMKTETPLGPYAVDDTGAQIAKKGLIVQVLGGKREVVWPFELESRKPVLPEPQWSAR